MLSQQSRMRMIRLINRMNLDKYEKNVFMTLTYPDTADCLSYKKRSQHRYLIMRAIERLKGRQLATLWRQEFLPRLSGSRIGELMPHMHIMIFDLPYVDKDYVNGTWKDIINHPGECITWTRRIKGKASAAKYLAKYVSKQSLLAISTYRNNGLQYGRQWGVTRPSLLPMHPLRVQREIDEREAAILKEWQRQRAPEGQPPTSGGFTALGKDVGDIAIALLNLDEPVTTR
jgi:hypothetical protein